MSEVNRYMEAMGGALKISSETINNAEFDQKNDEEILFFINSALSVSPGSIVLHERKVSALASLKRWSELCHHCKRLAAEMVKFDGILLGDLASLNPFPGIKSAPSLKPGIFERIRDNIANQVSPSMLSPDAVISRLPDQILPFYLRSLRLEGRCTDAKKALLSIMAKMIICVGDIPMDWLRHESDKLLRTMSCKEIGDALFNNGEYEHAATKYAACLTIDRDGIHYNQNSPENNDAGGMLHAVLHFNRAACLMALKRNQEAAKECTAALQIHPYYTQAMLCRGRCFALMHQYHEAVADYESYILLVDDAKGSSQNASDSNTAYIFDTPTDVAEEEYLKAKEELLAVRSSMAAPDANGASQHRNRQKHYNPDKVGETLLDSLGILELGSGATLIEVKKIHSYVPHLPPRQT